MSCYVFIANCEEFVFMIKEFIDLNDVMKTTIMRWSKTNSNDGKCVNLKCWNNKVLMAS